MQIEKNAEKNWKHRLLAGMRKAYRWGDEHIPPGLRLILGLLLMVGGVFGILPVLGFWMVPVGAVLFALDIPPLRRWLRGHLRPHDTGTDDSKAADRSPPV